MFLVCERIQNTNYLSDQQSTLPFSVPPPYNSITKRHSFEEQKGPEPFLYLPGEEPSGNETTQRPVKTAWPRLLRQIAFEMLRLWKMKMVKWVCLVLFNRHEYKTCQDRWTLAMIPFVGIKGYKMEKLPGLRIGENVVDAVYIYKWPMEWKSLHIPPEIHREQEFNT